MCSTQVRGSCETDSFRLRLLQVIVLVGVLALFLWLGMRPQSPSYTIAYISIPTPKVDQGNQNGTIFYMLEIQNPNKDSSIYYMDFIMTFAYNDDTIGQKTVANFHQKKNNKTLNVDQVDAGGKAWKALLSGVANKTAQLRVTVTNRIRYQTLGIKSKYHGMHMQGNIQIGPDGKIAGKKKQIKLRSAARKWRLK